ncbi:MAG: hypothetical protein SGI73_14410 [Chloroflexota bacterium]|nr:hypothetical protein [Chloroflexota bacterium]
MAIRPLRDLVLALCLSACAVLSAACEPTADTLPLPTTTLVQFPPTDTPTALPPTATSQSLPAPGDLIEAAAPPPTPDASDDLTAIDPIAAELVERARAYIAEQNDLPVRRVRLVEVQRFIWRDTSLGCPTAGFDYAPAQVDGYRIVLTTGEQFHLFHTDFDRLVPCTAENEVLPGDAEATVEAAS